MTKNEFLAELKRYLSALPSEDVQASLDYYGEMIDDRIEEGISEEEAVGAIGSAKDIAAQVMEEIPITKLVKAKIKPKRTLRAWEVIFLVLGSPIWVTLLLAAVIVVFSVYISLWACVISLYAADLCFFACALAGIIGFFAAGNIGAGLFLLGAGVLLAGLGILGFFGCKALTIAMYRLSKLILKGIRNCFINREVVK